jgi:GNAT superfamily N-acetyltransferase
MEIIHVKENKKEYLELLLLADEQESMVDRYLERGDMYVLEDHGVKACCVVTKEAAGVYELKNIAVRPDAQRKGYAKALIAYVFNHYPDCQTMMVGTGDVPCTLNFYRRCGFEESHRVKNFFTDHYDHAIYDDGTQLIDMVYLKKDR